MTVIMALSAGRRRQLPNRIRSQAPRRGFGALGKSQGTEWKVREHHCCQYGGEGKDLYGRHRILAPGMKMVTPPMLACMV